MAPKKNNKFQRVWYCLKNPNGEPYPGTSADAVSLASGSDIVQFRDELKIKIPDTLKGIDAFKLTVYKNKASLDKALEDKKKPDSKDNEEQPLDEDSPIVGLGKTKKDALMVVVPDPTIGREAKLQKLEPELPKGKIVSVSDWFLSELLPVGPAVEMDAETLMTMTYNGTMSNVILENPMEGQVQVEFKYFEMNFPILANIRLEYRISKVFVRPCYEPLFNVLLKSIALQGSTRNVSVCGNPGIGKSRFYAYCVLRLSKEWHSENDLLSGKKGLSDEQYSELLTSKKLLTVKEASMGKTLVINAKHKYYVLKDGCFHKLYDADFDSYSGDPGVVRLIDGTSTQLDGWAGVTILFTSPGSINYDQFVKDEGSEYIMPPWTLEELIIAAPKVAELDVVEIRSRFSEYGGNARFVFSSNQTKRKAQIRNALKKVDPLSLIQSVTLADGASENMYSHKIVQMYPRHIDGKIYEEHFLDFACDKLANKIFSNLLVKCFDGLKEFLMIYNGDPNSAAFQGTLFESLCHRLFSSDGTVLLNGRYLPGTETFSIQIPETVGLIFFNKLEEILPTTFEEPFYGRPVSPNFPCIDAVYWDMTTCYLLQMTISYDHGILHAQLNKILEWCGNRARVFVFVVPNDKMEMYPVQRYLKSSASQVQNAEISRVSPEVSHLRQCVVGVEILPSLKRVATDVE